MNECSVRKGIELIGKKWTLLIIHALYIKGSSRRFSEIKSSVQGITSKVLSERLKELEENDIVLNEVDSTIIPISSSYKLTAKGMDLFKIVKDLKSWSIKWSSK